jgi:hypothetical protein
MRGVLRQSGAMFGAAGGRAALIGTAVRISATYPRLELFNQNERAVARSNLRSRSP